MPEAKVLVITGAGSGIGYQTALEAARQGFAVLAVSRHEPALYELAATIVHGGGACAALPLDVTTADAPQRIVQAARESFGRIDVLINNAGAATAGRLLEQTDERINAQWELHVAAPLRITRAALPILQESRGQVMFVGSGLARVPSPYYGAYCAAKAAVRAMTTQLRRELHGTGVAVTYIDPGSVRTNFAKTAGIPSFGPEWAVAEPERVARRIVRAAKTRPAILNAIPMHTFGAMLGEWFPHFADRAMRKRTPPEPVPQPPPPVDVPTEVPQPVPQPAPGETAESAFERALEPVSRRMERVKLPASFLADLLRTGEDIQLAEAAMRWAGMPNKNERAAMAEALDALTSGGYLKKTGDESWRVLRSAS
ncbi:MAG TPA: SDR family NAD(P)-dependent oxidoreductase [Candidatus Baltobacteraceae bacterium]|nr:SDR family NAD(P)-dependent oxidoreductase [Candidatus Baltobacteraceae bacterium]